jgi:hypothetical protein
MDQAGGDRDGMPECPWCHSDSADSHSPGCELVALRAAVAAARSALPVDEKEAT